MDEPSSPILFLTLTISYTLLFLAILLPLTTHLQTERARLRTVHRVQSLAHGIRNLENEILILDLAISRLEANIESPNTRRSSESRPSNIDDEYIREPLQVHLSPNTTPPPTKPSESASSTPPLYFRTSSSTHSSRSSLLSGRTLVSTPNLSGETLVQSSSDSDNGSLTQHTYVDGLRPVAFSLERRPGLTMAEEMQVEELEAELVMRQLARVGVGEHEVGDEGHK